MSDDVYHSPHEYTLDSKLSAYSANTITKEELRDWFYNQFMKYSCRCPDDYWYDRLDQVTQLLEKD